ncbi:hypothetical protein HKD37_03G006777 [Glycine soja]
MAEPSKKRNGSSSTTTVVGQRRHGTFGDPPAPPNPFFSSQWSLTLFSLDEQHQSVVASFGYRKDVDGQWVRKHDLPPPIPDEHTPSPPPQRDSSSSLLNDILTELRCLRAFASDRFDAMDSRITHLEDDMSFICRCFDPPTDP